MCLYVSNIPESVWMDLMKFCVGIVYRGKYGFQAVESKLKVLRLVCPLDVICSMFVVFYSFCVFFIFYTLFLWFCEQTIAFVGGASYGRQNEGENLV